MNFSAKQQGIGKLCFFNTNNNYRFNLYIRQLMRVSLLFSILLFASFQFLAASTSRAQDIAVSTVNIGLHDEPLASAIKNIEKQTAFRFIYRRSDINQLNLLTLPAGKRTVTQTLYDLLKGTPFSFRQIDQNILIERKASNQLKDRKISGEVYLDNPHRGVSNGLIELLRKSDTTLVDHGYTDTTGHFLITTQDTSEILLRVSVMGYQVATAAINAGTNDAVVPPILLIQSIKQLKEVVVTAAQPLIQRKSDRFVIGVGNSSLSLDNNVWGILKKVPLVNANENGALSIIGKQAAIVYVNGRKSNLTGESLYNYLKSLPASTINNIEIITSPGSEFDAAGNSGVINIIFKKRETDGYQGSVSFSSVQASHNSENVNGSINYRKGKLGINFSPYDNRIRQYIPEIHNTNFANLSTNGLLENTTLNRQETKNYYGENLGVEYNITPKQSIAATINTSFFNQTLNYTGNSFFSDEATGKVDSGFVSSNKRQVTGHLMDFGANYHIDLDTLGQSLNINAGYFNYLNSGTQTIFATLTGSGQVRQNEHSVLPQKVKSYTFAVDYKLPVNQKIQLKAGVRSFNTYTDNNLYYAVANANGVYIKDTLRTTDYNYQEHINAFYTNIDYSWSKELGITAGLRLEQSNTSGKELIHDMIAVNKSYLNLFPTVSINYNSDEDHQFSYTLSKRLNRPSFWELNTFRVYLNPTDYVEGNPFLQPSYILKNEVTFTLKSKYTFLVNYVHTSNDFAQFLLANDTNNVVRGIRLNYGTANEANVAFIVNQAFGKIFQTAITATATYSSYHGIAIKEPINNEGISASLKINNTIYISRIEKWTGYMDINYSTPQIINYSQNSKVLSSGTLNMGLRKVIDKFTLSLYGTDLLKTSADRLYINTLFARNYTKNYYDNQSIQLMIKYNFGNSKLRKNQSHDNSAKDIINRTGK